MSSSQESTQRYSLSSRRSSFYATSDEDNKLVAAQFEADYKIEKLLGKGASARVLLVRNKKTNQQLACKVIEEDRNMNDARTMLAEVAIMKRLDHKHVIRLEELYETPEKIWMVLEYANGGSLLQYISRLPEYSEVTVSKIFKQILLGVKYLHDNGIVHRDLKLDNILCEVKEKNKEQEEKERHGQGVGADELGSVTDQRENSEELIVKIADFGLSALTTFKDPDQSATNSSSSNSSSNMRKSRKAMKKLVEMWGTTEYLAPEVFRRAYGFQADVWSLGCLLYELLTSHTAFSSPESKTPFMEKLLFRGPLSSHPKRVFQTRIEYQGLSDSAKSLLKMMLKRDPMKRFDIEDCLAHPWISQIENLSSGTSTTVESSQNTQLHTQLPAYRLLKEQADRRAIRRDYQARLYESEALGLQQN